MKSKIAGVGAAAIVAGTVGAAAAGVQHSTTGVGGYDVVSYHEGKKPLPGNGNFLSEVDGVTYLFIDADNKKKFDAAPSKYLPAYGGYCAFGVSVGKKFVGDPTVWEIVDGRLYLNLDNGIKSQWVEDIPGNIAKSEAKWPEIEGTHPSKL